MGCRFPAYSGKEVKAMVKYIRDRTGRFQTRPHYTIQELDAECERTLAGFYKTTPQNIGFPISTDDLTVLIEQNTSDFDPGADLSHYGDDVEGVTEFFPGQKPRVKISNKLAYDDRRENRFRTTLTHEFGHVKFHAYLFEMEGGTADLFGKERKPAVQACKRESIIDARQTDWMEWQAGYACGAFLMPITGLRKLVGEYQEQHNIFGSISMTSTHAPAVIDAVRAHFQVSEDAARVRLLKLDMLTQGAMNQSLMA